MEKCRVEEKIREMKDGLLENVRVYAKEKFLQLSKLFSKVLFWFFVTLLLFSIVTGNNFLRVTFTCTTWWKDFYSLSSSFLIGALVSFLFYFLVVFIPERRKHRIVKANLRQQYRDLKKDIMYQVIFASQKGG